MVVASKTPVICGYKIIEHLYASSKTLVYRGIRLSDAKSVVIKCLASKYPSFQELLQLRNQHTLIKNLNYRLIIQTYSLEPFQNGYILVMEDFGGISLKDYFINQNKMLSLQEFLQIAISLCDILNILYEERIIHKDIKPSNILINPETKEVKLIDFSIASLLPQETQSLKNPNILEGTLAYISPEQTGRMNRVIDYRTDFYSLGVSFYELLTGKLPFTSSDVMELIHSHIAKTPSALGNREKTPQVIVDIVMKLMAKNAEDRYQSALGLKYDLETCLYQLKDIGKIEDFQIAQRDISDRFIIPDKLYGREAEVQMLLDGFERVTANSTSEMMLVAGLSGIGKTAVVNEVHKPIIRKRGYFIKGKYDQFNRNIPLDAFVQALRDLIRQLLSENDARIQEWKSKILSVVGESGQVIIDVIPQLEKIIGKQPPALELSGTAAQNRFNLLFKNFIRVFTSPEHPLVIFLDDLQWADAASLKLIQMLMGESQTSYLFFIGAYRDNEVYPTHPLMLMLDEIKNVGLFINTINLQELSQDSLNYLVEDALKSSPELAQKLSELIYQKTQGNPFFSTQFLKALYQDRLIIFDSQRGWEYDIERVREASLTDDVLEFMSAQLEKLPPETQEVLKLAACIGNQFDLNTLAIVSEKTQLEIARYLWAALQTNLIVPQTNLYKFYQGENDEKLELENCAHQKLVYYKFLHDRVQQAAISLIPNDRLQAVHLKIGQLLQEHLSETEKEEKLFDIIGHLNLAGNLIIQPSERESLAKLNLLAGKKAKNATAYHESNSYLQTGINLLPSNCWQKQYELTLNLYVAAAESAYLSGEFEEMEHYANKVLLSARNILDKIKIYEIQISALTGRSQMLAAIATSRNALAQLGIQLPENADENLTGIALENLNQKLQGREIEELLNLPIMSNPQVIAAMRLLTIIFPAVYQGNSALLPLLGSTMVSLSLEFGNAPASTIAYAMYGIVLSTFCGEVKRGYDFGILALNLLNQLNAKEFKPNILILFGLCLQHHQEALKMSIPTFKDGYLAAIETGDLLNAGYNINNFFDSNFYSGVCLDDWESEIENYCVLLATAKQDSPLAYLRMKQQMLSSWRNPVNEPDLLIGAAYDETLMLSKHQQNNELTAFVYAYIYKLKLAYAFGKYNNALDYIEQANLYLMGVTGTPHIPVFHFYAGLNYLALSSPQGETELETLNSTSRLAMVETHQEILTQWAHHTPMNHQHKVDLIEAEKCRVIGNNYEAGDWYDRAISGAKENGFIQEQALANELAAKFYLNWGKEKIAQYYMQEAYYCYTAWGATAKVAYLEKKYPELLAAILTRTNSAIKNEETITSLQIQTSTNSTNSQDLWLDWIAVMEAARAISQEIELEQLIATLMQTLLAISGAQSSHLLLYQNEQLFIVAKADSEQTQKLEISLEEYHSIPHNLIYSVKRTQEKVVFANLSKAIEFANDSYVINHQPKSALCTPIIQQGKLIGILYLENNLTADAFTSERLQVIQLLTAQAAISLKNSQLYEQLEAYSQTLEQKVEARTLELTQQATQLSDTLKELKRTQTQLIQSEKMSGLGNLVAGIAHEINNPVSFIHGNIKYVDEYTQDLLDAVNFCKESNFNPISIEQKLDELDLEFIAEDLPKTLKSMKTGTERIREIVLSLRTFSRMDEAEIKKVDIHTGIDSTLLILQHRLQEKPERPKIEVIKNYGQLPHIECYAGQLNQVFMSILTNAIDAIDEKDIRLNSQGIEGAYQQIKICTSIVDTNFVEIKISDSGVGMTSEIQQQIFNPFFTTKPVGKGTGMGMSISYQIITEKHGGKLNCVSTPNQGTEFIIQIPIYRSLDD